MKIQEICSKIALGLGAALALASTPAMAGKPGGGTSDPCATAVDFPAFAYRKQNSNKSWTIFVADSTGKCSRAIVSTPFNPFKMSYSYPIGGIGNRGRVIWQDNGIVGIDFTVSGNNIVLDPQTTFYPSPPACCLVDLSRDGQTLYFSRTNTVLATLDLAHTGSTPQDFYTFTNTPYGAQRGSVNGSQTLLFIEELEVDSTTKLVRLTLPPAAVDRNELLTNANGPFWVAANLDDDNQIAYLEYIAGTNYCGQLVVTDAAGENRMAILPRYGKFATWLKGDVLMERETMDSRGNCSLTGTISRVTLGSIETVLTSGTGPNGP